MTDLWWWFDVVTAWLWLVLALAGAALRIRRIIRLGRIRLAEPVHPADAAYLASVKRSTYLRLGVKIVFALGALIAVFHLPPLWPLWRVGVVLALVFMIVETLSVDHVRERLARAGATS